MSTKTPHLDFNAIRNAGIDLGSDSHVLGFGGQGVVIADRGTALKLYAATEGMPNVVSQARARTEQEALSFIAMHNDTGIQTPKPLDFKMLARPIDMSTSTGDYTFLAALRMEKLEITPAPFDLNWMDNAREAGTNFFRNMGRTIAAFNNLAARLPDDGDFMQADDLPKMLRQTTDKRQFQFVAKADVDILLHDHARLTAGKPHILAHGDLHPGNVSYNARTQGVNAVFDWACVIAAPTGRDMHHFANTTGSVGTQTRNDLVQQGYAETILQAPDPQLTSLYGVMQLARHVIRGEIHNDMDEGFARHVLTPYRHSLAAYMASRPSDPVPKASSGTAPTTP